ncbi:MAG: stage II sporulation protein D [Clostridia bacterium]|nr:stage II sporulation protein D [Clostridia bacterium]
MNLKMIGILTAIFTMLLAPFSVCFLGDGQAEAKSDSLDKSRLEDKAIEVYINATGEKKELDIEDYVCCVLLAEVPESFDEEATKAIAVAVRTYTCRRLESDEKYTKHFSAHMCDDYTHCLGFMTYEEAVSRWGEKLAKSSYDKIKKCVDETKGEILYYNGNVIDAVFHASSAGYTEDAKNVWGYDIPYLVSVETPEKYGESRVTLKGSELREILEKQGVSCNFEQAEEKWAESVEKDKRGRVKSICIGGTTLTGRRVREIFHLESTVFDLKYEDGLFIFDVKGHGHGVGLSQYGCQQLALDGKSYKEMLSLYYTGAELGLY